MKPTALLFLFLLTLTGYSQTFKPVTIIKQRSYYLNGGARAALADGKSREVIKIDLPPNTKGCYYSFTTIKGDDGTQLLNLGLQLGAAIYGGAPGMALASQIKVPEGSEAIDVYVLPVSHREVFLTKEDDKLKIYKDISLHSAKEAVQYIDNSKYGNSFYIGLRNPSALSGIGITIEVVALVDETKTNPKKASLYADLGWKAYEKGDYDQCIQLSNKALSYDGNLAYPRFTIALALLVQEKEESVDKNVDAFYTGFY